MKFPETPPVASTPTFMALLIAMPECRSSGRSGSSWWLQPKKTSECQGSTPPEAAKVEEKKLGMKPPTWSSLDIYVWYDSVYPDSDGLNRHWFVGYIPILYQFHIFPTRQVDRSCVASNLKAEKLDHTGSKNCMVNWRIMMKNYEVVGYIYIWIVNGYWCGKVKKTKNTFQMGNSWCIV